MKTLIFDFDGTLVDSMALYVISFNKLAKDFDLPSIRKEDIPLLRKMSSKELIKKYKIGPLKLAQLSYTINKNINREMAAVQFYPEIKSLLVKLSKKYQLGILSSNIPENIEAFLKKESLDIFDYIHCSKSLFGKAKTFTDLIKKYNLDKKEILYFGDEVRDIEACQKIKVKIAAVTWGFNEKDLLITKKPDYLFSSPDEIADLLI